LRWSVERTWDWEGLLVTIEGMWLWAVKGAGDEERGGCIFLG
jgi:hypothetical protein